MKSMKVIAMAAIMIATASCKEGNKNEPGLPMSNEKHQETVSESNDTDMDNEQMAEIIFKDYFNLKDALVASDNTRAKELGATLATSLGNFNSSDYSQSDRQELTDIVEDATEHAEHIAESDIKHQREHFKILSKDMSDMLAITGATMTIYEQYCPMYDNNKGGAWLSMNEEIRNPYFGAQMLKCGKVQREIN